MQSDRDGWHLPIVGLVGGGFVLWLLTRGARDTEARGPGSGAVDGAAPTPCQVRVTAGGLTVNDALSTIPATTVRCLPVGAEVVVTGDAREGDWNALRAALDAAGVTWSLRSPAKP